MAYIYVDLDVERERDEGLWLSHNRQWLSAHLYEVLKQVADLLKLIEEADLPFADYDIRVDDQDRFLRKGIREVGAYIIGKRSNLLALVELPEFRHEWLCGLSYAAAVGRVIGE